MTRTITEPSRQTPVRAEVDVLVCGGGLGGVSAAVASARAGAKTLLVERNGFPGGVATAGACCSVFNCLYTPSHELAVRGNALEFVDALARADGSGPNWHDHKGHIIHDLERAKLTLIDLLEDAGADYLFDAPAAGVLMEEDALLGVCIESKSGREAVLAKTVVDATGDADIAHLSGAPVRTTGAWAKHSYPFRVGGVDVDAFVQYFADHPDQYPPYMDIDWDLDGALAHYEATGTLLFPHGGGIQMDLIRRGLESGEYPETVGVQSACAALQMHAIRDLGAVHMITGWCEIEDLDVAQITRAMTDGKRMAYAVTDYFRKHVPGFASAHVDALADDLGIRASRWIEGEFDFTGEMKKQETRFADAVGVGVVQHDFKKSDAPGAWGCQTFKDETYDIPYRCLVPKGVDGLLMGAGRSVSQENPMLLRVMALTMVTGQAAGVGAAVSADTNASPRATDIAAIQSELKRQGVNLP
ncbi:MAG TPA: FAD-dependent oxidoreductase [Armatimonadota bacterium]|nr:FAD-dependent oxidoreductase [Armatimonadota bacterium]